MGCMSAKRQKNQTNTKKETQKFLTQDTGEQNQNSKLTKSIYLCSPQQIHQSEIILKIHNQQEQPIQQKIETQLQENKKLISEYEEQIKKIENEYEEHLKSYPQKQQYNLQSDQKQTLLNLQLQLTNEQEKFIICSKSLDDLYTQKFLQINNKAIQFDDYQINQFLQLPNTSEIMKKVEEQSQEIQKQQTKYNDLLGIINNRISYNNQQKQEYEKEQTQIVDNLTKIEENQNIQQDGYLLRQQMRLAYKQHQERFKQIEQQMRTFEEQVSQQVVNLQNSIINS